MMGPNLVEESAKAGPSGAAVLIAADLTFLVSVALIMTLLPVVAYFWLQSARQWVASPSSLVRFMHLAVWTIFIGSCVLALSMIAVYMHCAVPYAYVIPPSIPGCRVEPVYVTQRRGITLAGALMVTTTILQFRKPLSIGHDKARTYARMALAAVWILWTAHECTLLTLQVLIITGADQDFDRYSFFRRIDYDGRAILYAIYAFIDSSVLVLGLMHIRRVQKASAKEMYGDEHVMANAAANAKTLRLSSEVLKKSKYRLIQSYPFQEVLSLCSEVLGHLTAEASTLDAQEQVKRYSRYVMICLSIVIVGQLMFAIISLHLFPPWESLPILVREVSYVIFPAAYCGITSCAVMFLKLAMAAHQRLTLATPSALVTTFPEPNDLAAQVRRALMQEYTPTVKPAAPTDEAVADIASRPAPSSSAAALPDAVHHSDNSV